VAHARTQRNGRPARRSDEHTKRLSLVGAKPRDDAILQVFLQTGSRWGASEWATRRIEQSFSSSCG
jgi:hypothetical protein